MDMILINALYKKGIINEATYKNVVELIKK